jgi:hypothetical protein
MSGSTIDISKLEGYAASLPQLQVSKAEGYGAIQPQLQISKLVGYAVLLKVHTGRPFIIRPSRGA